LGADPSGPGDLEEGARQGEDAVRVVIAPDKFKGTLSAPQAAAAIAAGVTRARPEAEIVILPVADGGDGTAEVMRAAIGGEVDEIVVTGPLNAPVRASLTRLGDGRAVVEMAAASGLVAAGGDRRPLTATSRGTGELLRAALERTEETVMVGIGGSASSDGGTGAATAVGWRFLDGRGRELPPGGAALEKLHAISSDAVSPRLRNRTVVGVTDVDNPLLGPRGAAAVFGPQKGASARDVERLEAGLARLAEVVASELGRDLGSRERGGAGGGMGAGLIAFFGAALEPGFTTVAEVIGLREAVAGAGLVITGEGRLDVQSLGGKAPAGVAQLAAAARVPCVAVAGEVAVSETELADLELQAAVGLVAEVGEARARGDPRGALAEVTVTLLNRLGAPD
jgi:glycerate 2-kinase